MLDFVEDVVSLPGGDAFELRDGTGVIQCVAFRGDLAADVFSLCGELTQEF